MMEEKKMKKKKGKALGDPGPVFILPVIELHEQPPDASIK